MDRGTCNEQPYKMVTAALNVAHIVKFLIRVPNIKGAFLKQIWKSLP